jgi:hypothetical protein
MPRRPQKPKKKAFDIQRPVCYNVANAGEIVAASQVDRGPDQNLIPAANGFHGSPKSESNQLPTDSYNVLSKRELINLLRRKPSCFDDVDLLCLTSSITRRLETLRARAREGNWVEEASEFARWLLSSGLIKLLEGVKGELRCKSSPMTRCMTVTASGVIRGKGLGSLSRSWKRSMPSWIISPDWWRDFRPL